MKHHKVQRLRFNLALGHVVAFWMEKRAVSRIELSERTNITHAEIGHIIKGTGADCWDFRQVAHALDLTVNDMYRDVGEVVTRTDKAVEALQVTDTHKAFVTLVSLSAKCVINGYAEPSLDAIR